jgi:hypothetical protein
MKDATIKCYKIEKVQFIQVKSVNVHHKLRNTNKVNLVSL